MPIPVSDSLARLEAATGDGTLEAVCAGLGVELLVLFGSAADADGSGAPHDIDVAVGFKADHRGDVIAVHEALERVAPGDHFDVLDLDRAGPVARVEALTKGRILVERTPHSFTRREMYALGEYMETEHRRTALLREFAR